MVFLERLNLAVCCWRNLLSRKRLYRLHALKAFCNRELVSEIGFVKCSDAVICCCFLDEYIWNVNLYKVVSKTIQHTAQLSISFNLGNQYVQKKLDENIEREIGVFIKFAYVKVVFFLLSTASHQNCTFKLHCIVVVKEKRMIYTTHEVEG